MIVSCDPGNATGLGVFSPQGVLINTLVLKKSPEMMHRFLVGVMNTYGPITDIVTEVPQIYRARNSKGNPNDLIGLAVQCGWLEGLAQCLYIPTVYLVRPREWKGQIPKEISRKRSQQQLSEHELERADSLLFKLAAGKQHNAWDAIGIGLWYCRKLRLR